MAALRHHCCACWPESQVGCCLLLQHWLHTLTRALAHSVKRIVQTKIPNLANVSDISEYVLGAQGSAYASDSEGDDEDNQVTLPQDLKGRGNVKSGRSAIRLVELGPRLTLSLLKIEEGICDGEVLYHSFSTWADTSLPRGSTCAHPRSVTTSQEDAGASRCRAQGIRAQAPPQASAQGRAGEERQAQGGCEGRQARGEEATPGGAQASRACCCSRSHG